MSWEYDLAKELKRNTERTRKKAVEEASFYKGKIEKLSPLTVSAMGGELMYEEGENLLVSPQILDYTEEIIFERDGITTTLKRKNILKKGAAVLLAPVDGADVMAVIDIVKE